MYQSTYNRVKYAGHGKHNRYKIKEHGKAQVKLDFDHHPAGKCKE